MEAERMKKLLDAFNCTIPEPIQLNKIMLNPSVLKDPKLGEIISRSLVVYNTIPFTYPLLCFSEETEEKPYFVCDGNHRINEYKKQKKGMFTIIFI